MSEIEQAQQYRENVLLFGTPAGLALAGAAYLIGARIGWEGTWQTILHVVIFTNAWRLGRYLAVRARYRKHVKTEHIKQWCGWSGLAVSVLGLLGLVSSIERWVPWQPGTMLALSLLCIGFGPALLWSLADAPAVDVSPTSDPEL